MSAHALTGPDYAYEQRHLGCGYVIGVDEAGRGPWAGPVCVAACWIDPNALAKLPASLNDSKKLSAKKRAIMAQQITQAQSAHHLAYHACFASVEDIDTLGILQANFKAMAEAVTIVANRLLVDDPLALAASGHCQIAAVLVDGNLTPPLPYPAEAIIKGDGKVLSIAAASIIAKQSRDDVMAELHQAYPYYGWDSNQGYGTKAHQHALDRYGICAHHRRSFAPIKKRLAGN